MKKKSVGDRLIEANLVERKAEVEKRFGKDIFERVSIRKLATHQYLFEIEDCDCLPGGFVEMPVALSKSLAETNGWNSLIASGRRKIIDL